MVMQNDPSVFPRLNQKLLMHRAESLVNDYPFIKEVHIQLVGDHPAPNPPVYAVVCVLDDSQFSNGNPVVSIIADYQLLLKRAMSQFAGKDSYKSPAPSLDEIKDEWEVILRKMDQSLYKAVIVWEDKPIQIRLDEKSFWKLYPVKKPTSISSKPAIQHITLAVPEGTTWDDITIRFVDGHIVNISVQGTDIQNKRYSYPEMGFADGRSGNYNFQWELLKMFAENYGRLSWTSHGAIDKNKKRKQKLADTLKTFFQLKDDPFHKYNPSQGYVARFKILPED